MSKWLLNLLDHMSRRIALWCIVIAIQCLSDTLILSDYLLTILLEYVCLFFQVPPAGDFPIHECAVAIVGGEQDLGGKLALEFSELGYTVFTLHYTEPVDHSTPTSGVSSANLLYVWHRKKEESQHSSWGLVAPIALDTESGAQRRRASETIQAFCTKNSLHLVSLIVLAPDTTSTRWHNVISRDHKANTSDVPTPKRLADRELARTLVFSDTMARLIKESIVVVQDYIELLSEAAGRVIVVTPCSGRDTIDDSLTYSTDGVRQSIIRYLSPQLELYGIKTCIVSTGPTQGSDSTLYIHPFDFLHRVNGWAGLVQKSIYNSSDVYSAVKQLSQICSVPDTALSDIVQHIVSAKYPRQYYSVGIHPFLHYLSEITPEFLQQLVRSLGEIYHT